MPPTLPVTSSFIQVDFYNTTISETGSIILGDKNTAYYGKLFDHRNHFTCSLKTNVDGEPADFKDATLSIDSFNKSSNVSKMITLQVDGADTIVVKETSTTTSFVSSDTFPFVNEDTYSLKMLIELFGPEVDGIRPTIVLVGKFTYGSVTPSPQVYKFIYRETPDEFVSTPPPVITNRGEIQKGSSIKITAPMAFVEKDPRRPKTVKVKFDVADVEEGDTNSEFLSTFISEVVYLESGLYEFPDNKLENGYQYKATLQAVYEDGYKPFINIPELLSVFNPLTITNVLSYGLGLDGLAAGDSKISNIMDITMKTDEPGVFTGGETITFTLTQTGSNIVFYTFTVPVQTGINPVYNIDKNTTYVASPSIGSIVESSRANGGGTFYRFQVTAQRSYTRGTGADAYTVDKVSNSVTSDFALDINSLGPVLVDNQWTTLGVVNRKVELDSQLSQAKWDLISEYGYLAKFSKNEFFGTGITGGLFQDLDKEASTKFKVELSQDSGVTFAPVKSLRMKQGTAASSATEDRTQWISLLDQTALTNDEGLYPNIPWTSTQALGPQQPPLYLIADCVAPSPTPIPGIFSLNGAKTKYTDVNMTSVKHDSTITVATIPNKDGWTIKNSAGTKLNLRYYKNPVSGYVAANGQSPSENSKQTPADSFTLEQASGLGLYAVFNQNAGAKQYPVFVAYTTPTGTDDKTSLFKSGVFYAPTTGNPLNSGLTLAFTGTDDGSFLPDITRRVKYTVNTDRSDIMVANANSYLTEFVNVLSLQTLSTDSVSPAVSPGDFDFQLLETGMFTSHASTGLVSLKYNEHSRLVLAVSIIAPEATRPNATQSNQIRVMSKVNTPTTGESGSYNISTRTLTVNVANSDPADKMTGVLFTSDLVSPDNSVVVPNPGATNNFKFDRTNISKASLPAPTGPTDILKFYECKFKIAYNVTDDNGGSDITGLQGPEITVPLLDAPSIDNYVIVNFNYKTMNDHTESSFSFGAAFNSLYNTKIVGLKCYFNTTADFTSSTSSKVLVKDVKRSEGLDSEGLDTVQSIVVNLNTSFAAAFGNWSDLSVGYVEFVPYFNDNDTLGSPIVREVPDQQTRFGIYNVLPISSIAATLEGGVVQAATTLRWTGVVGDTQASFNLSRKIYSPAFQATDLSSSIVASDTNFSSVFSPINGVENTLSLKRQITLPEMARTTSPVFYPLASNTWYGPVTNVSFIPVSVDTSSMALSVKKGSNSSQLLTSHAEATISDTSKLVVTAKELCKVVGLESTALTFSSGTDSTALLQKPVITNTYTLSGESLGGLLDLKMRVKAGVKYDYKVGSATNIVKDTSSVTLPLGPSTQYRVAAVLTVTSTNKYTVNNDRIGVAVSINANGLALEGLATVVAFISQDSAYTDANDAQAGVGGTALAVFGPGSTRTYTVGANANGSSTIDNLAPGEEATTTPVNLSASVNEIEVGEYKLNVGNLSDTDVTVLSFPKAGFNPTQPIGVMLIVTNRLGHDVLSTVATYAPPVFLSRAANLTTIQYTGTAQAVVDAYSDSTPKPYFIQEDPRSTGTTEWFAVVNNSSKAKILEYAKSAGSAVSTYFTPPGQSSPVPFNNIVTTSMTNFSELFIYSTSFNKSISDWDTSNVTIMSKMFYGAVAFNQDISKWNTSKVTNMSFAFWNSENNSAFNQNIGSWDVSNVTDMRSMFRGANKFNNGGNSSISSWNTAKVSSMSQLFYHASAFNQDIGSWNTGQVQIMEYMFWNATEFDQNIGSWNVSNVTDMSSMFMQAGKFNNGGNSSIGSWNVSKVLNMSSMFNQCVTFNQNIGSWNTGNVYNMESMFMAASSFNQNISGWVVNKVVQAAMFTAFRMFSGLSVGNTPPAFLPPT